LRIAVVIPAYNAAAFLDAAIRSVLAQSHADWRMAVVDDGSTDASAAIASAHADPRIAVLRQANRGVSAARNRGAAAVGGDAVLFLDADDRLAPDALARLHAALRRDPAAVASTGPARFFAAGRAPKRRGLPALRGAALRGLLVRNRLANGGQILIRRTALERAGPFRTGLSFGEDWELWIRLAMQGAFAAAPGPAPVLHVQERAEGAYLRHVADPAAARPALDAIYANPLLSRRFSARELARLRRRAEAEAEWVAGRALLRTGRWKAGWPRLLRAQARAPRVRRIIFLPILGLEQVMRQILVVICRAILQLVVDRP
jgi:glycosyltransferase involved in cell wall biosynthesis